MLKKRLFIFLCFICLLFTISSCNKKHGDNNDIPKEDVIKTLSVDEKTIKDKYYEGEFNIASINLIYTEDGKETIIKLLPSMVDNYPTAFTKGTYVLNINYKELSCNITINIIEKEVYTNELLFGLSQDKSYYIVKGIDGDVENIVIPSRYNDIPVKEIGTEAFMNNQNIKTVVLGDNISLINDSAFARCTNLSKVVFCNNLKTIGKGAFYNVSTLNSIFIPKSVTQIGDNAFNKVKTIYLENNSEINSTNFYDTGHAVLFKDIVKDQLFRNDEFEYYLDNNEITLMNYLKDEETVSIPAQLDGHIVTKIGDYCFYNKTSLNNINFEEGIKEIGKNSFKNAGITALKMPSTLHKIDELAFAYCENLTNIELNEGLTLIERSAFSNCITLPTISFPSTLEKIDAYGFQNCHQLKTIYLNNNITYLGEGVFYAARATIYMSKTINQDNFDSNWNLSKATISYID